MMNSAEWWTFDQNFRADEALPSVVLEEDGAWKPLAAFIGSYPHSLIGALNAQISSRIVFSKL